MEYKITLAYEDSKNTQDYLFKIYVVHAPLETRLHHLVHIYHTSLECNKNSLPLKYIPVDNFKKLWKTFERYWEIPSSFKHKFKGKINCGIVIENHNGNYCDAFAKHKGNIYWIRYCGS